MAWKNDEALAKELTRLYCYEGLEREEVLSYMEGVFPDYSWSLRSLCRRLQYFGIKKIDKQITVVEVVEAVADELRGPGQLLGYRAMHKKLKTERGLNVPRDLVYAAMTDLNRDAMQERAPKFKRKRKQGKFKSVGPNWMFSLDVHDKLMGYQNSTLPLAIYGCLDSCSRKIIYLKIWTANSKPLDVGRWYFDYLCESKRLPKYLSVDKGSKTGVMAAIHAMLSRAVEGDVHSDEDAFDRVLCEPSASNKVDQWWKECHERLRKLYERDLKYILDYDRYNPESKNDRSFLAYILIPVIQKELDIFKDSIWNIHRLRNQENVEIPGGNPNHIYDFPGEYELEDYVYNVTEEQLQAVGEQSGVLGSDEHYHDRIFRQRCEKVIPNPSLLRNDEWVHAYVRLRKEFNA